MPYKSEAHRLQLEAARHKAHTDPKSAALRSASLAHRWNIDRDRMLAGMRAMQSPEARRRAADANRRPLAVKFNEKVSPEPNSGCWLWLGSTSNLGYGQMRVDGRAVLATHISLALAGKPRPSPKSCALHSCDIPCCVNPAHLRWGSLKDNTADSIMRGRADQSGLALGHDISRAKRKPRIAVTCEGCGVDFEKPPWNYNADRHHFCSTVCCATWQKAAYTGKPISSWAT